MHAFIATWRSVCRDDLLRQGKLLQVVVERINNLTATVDSALVCAIFGCDSGLELQDRQHRPVCIDLLFHGFPQRSMANGHLPQLLWELGGGQSPLVSPLEEVHVLVKALVVQPQLLGCDLNHCDIDYASTARQDKEHVLDVQNERLVKKLAAVFRWNGFIPQGRPHSTNEV